MQRARSFFQKAFTCFAARIENVGGTELSRGHANNKYIEPCLPEEDYEKLEKLLDFVISWKLVGAP
jgi:hypothetical protein